MDSNLKPGSGSVQAANKIDGKRRWTLFQPIQPKKQKHQPREGGGGKRIKTQKKSTTFSSRALPLALGPFLFLSLVDCLLLDPLSLVFPSQAHPHTGRRQPAAPSSYLCVCVCRVCVRVRVHTHTHTIPNPRAPQRPPGPPTPPPPPPPPPPPSSTPTPAAVPPGAGAGPGPSEIPPPACSRG